ncbi:MFS transporter, partial [Lactobacillus sp. XV13L]|nr:MFS transporter [Lactobacillus sp. XV13L]
MNNFWKNQGFQHLTIANCLSSAGDVLFYLAFITYASKLSHPTFALSLIAMSEAIPKLFASLGGYWADKTQHKFSQLIILAEIRASIYLIISFLFAQSWSGWQLICLVMGFNFMSDMLGVYASGLSTPVIIQLVSPAEFSEAVGFSNGITQI